MREFYLLYIFIVLRLFNKYYVKKVAFNETSLTPVSTTPFIFASDCISDQHMPEIRDCLLIIKLLTAIKRER